MNEIKIRSSFFSPSNIDKWPTFKSSDSRPAPIFLIGFHLKHGFQSALKTLGFTYKTNTILYRLSFLFWGLIPAGFIIIILSIQIGIIQ